MLRLELMIMVDDEKFNNLMADSLDELPNKYTSKLDNLLITFENNPTETQMKKLNLRKGHTLFGLYEGIPLTNRGNGYSLVLPDKITLFKFPLQFASNDIIELKANIKHTLWHEIAHYFGLNHKNINEIEKDWKF